MIDNFKEVTELTNIVPYRQDEDLFAQVELKKNISDPPIQIWRVRCKKDLDTLKYRMIALARYHNAKIYIHPTSYRRSLFYRTRLLELSKENVYGVFTDGIDSRIIKSCESSVKRYVYEFPNIKVVDEYLSYMETNNPDFNRNSVLSVPGINCIQIITYENCDMGREVQEILLYDPDPISGDVMPKKYTCDRCGSDRVFTYTKINPNNNEQYTTTEHVEGDRCWCEVCRSDTRLKIV